MPNVVRAFSSGEDELSSDSQRSPDPQKVKTGAVNVQPLALFMFLVPSPVVEGRTSPEYGV